MKERRRNGENGVLKKSAMHLININIKLFYMNNAIYQCFNVFKKMNSKVQKWIYFNV